MEKRYFNEAIEKYEKVTYADEFNDVQFLWLANLTEKQRDKFASLMLTKGCAIRRNHKNQYFVYTNMGVGVKIQNDTLMNIISQ